MWLLKNHQILNMEKKFIKQSLVIREWTELCFWRSTIKALLPVYDSLSFCFREAYLGWDAPNSPVVPDLGLTVCPITLVFDRPKKRRPTLLLVRLGVMTSRFLIYQSQNRKSLYFRVLLFSFEFRKYLVCEVKNIFSVPTNYQLSNPSLSQWFMMLYHVKYTYIFFHLL